MHASMDEVEPAATERATGAAGRESADVRNACKPSKQQTFLWRDAAEMLRQCVRQAPQGRWSHHAQGFTCRDAATGAVQEKASQLCSMYCSVRSSLCCRLLRNACA